MNGQFTSLIHSLSSSKQKLVFEQSGSNRIILGFTGTQTETGIHGDYELEYILVEGHCFDQLSGQPPRGLQFTLGNKQRPVTQDTIVMANLVSKTFGCV